MIHKLKAEIELLRSNGFEIIFFFHFDARGSGRH